jgi:hypothetical protein
MLERRAAAVAVKLAAPTAPPAAPQSAFSSLLSRVYTSPPSNDPHVDRIRSDRVFYGWLERRFADYMQGVVGLQVVTRPWPCDFDWSIWFRFVYRCCFHVLMRLQAPEGTGGIWSASDVRVLGGVEGQDDAGDLSDA